jgi:hypothetical protein
VQDALLTDSEKLKKYQDVKHKMTEQLWLVHITPTSHIMQDLRFSWPLKIWGSKSSDYEDYAALRC